MGSLSYLKSRVCVEWTTEEVHQGDLLESPDFDFQGVESCLKLRRCENPFVWNLHLNPCTPYDWNTVINVHVKGRSGKVLQELSTKRFLKPGGSAWCIWTFSESNIRRVDPDIVSKGIIRFMVTLEADGEPERKTKGKSTFMHNVHECVNGI